MMIETCELHQYAAMFVIGKSANCFTSWKTKDGKSLKSLESDQTGDGAQ